MSHTDYSINVFINCPVDEKYKVLLNIIIFVILLFGFKPRLAIETSDASTLRINKITELIKESVFSIHDLSRIRAKSEGEFYRLNMPFELGIDYALRTFLSKYKNKRFLILSDTPYGYMKALSDLNGIDIKNHNNNPTTLIKALRSWFAETGGLKGLDATPLIYNK